MVYALDAIQSPVSLYDPGLYRRRRCAVCDGSDSDKKNREENWVESISLNEAMQRLDEREKQIIRLRFYEGRTQMEVASEIGISQAQVSRLGKKMR